jgi:hypothetical protein
MAIARKPKTKKSDNNDVDIDALINKGGSIADTSEDSQNNAKREDAKEKKMSLRIPMLVSDRVDDVIKNRLLRISRHAWILDAIVEKLEREETN